MHKEPFKEDAGGYMGDWKRGAPLGRASLALADLLQGARASLESSANSLEYFESFIARDLVPSHLDSMDKVRELAETRRAEVARYTSIVAKLEAAPKNPPYYLQEVRLDSGGYDQGGAYWGHHQKLYCAFNDYDVQMYVRAINRDAAKIEVRASDPTARFFR